MENRTKNVHIQLLGVFAALVAFFSSARGVSAQEVFDKLNPLKIGAPEDIQQMGASSYADQLSTPGGLLTRTLQYAFPLAGLVLFVMLVWGGFEILMGASTPKSKDNGKQRITAALIGFLLLFASYWIAQLIQIIFDIRFLGI